MTTTAIKAAITELNAAINTLSRFFPEDDKGATAALLSSTTARAFLRDALEAEALAAQATRQTPKEDSAVLLRPICHPTGAATTSSIMEELWNRAAPGFDRESLAWFAGATAQAECVAASLQDVVEGVACLVSCDSPSAGRVASGSFQSHDSLPALLLTIANVLDSIRGLSHIGDEASHRLYRPEFYR